MTRAALTIGKAIVIVILVGMAGLTNVRAADYSAAPNTLGAQVSATVIGDEGGTAFVVNMGSVPTMFRALAPDGWTVSPATLTLAPDVRGTFTLSGHGEPGDMTIVGSPVAGVNADSTAIRFGPIAVMQSRPFDPLRIVPAVLGSLLGLVAVFSVWRRLRRYSFRIERKMAHR